MPPKWDGEDKATHRMRDGSLATHATSKIKWARISHGGKVHRVEHVIVRWNFKGGTRDKPDVTFVMACGPQRHNILPSINEPYLARCARCDSKCPR